MDRLQLNNHQTVTTYYNYLVILYIKRERHSLSSSGCDTQQELKELVIQAAAVNDQVLYLQHILPAYHHFFSDQNGHNTTPAAFPILLSGGRD